jgi:glycosyltransferase involved in cell wall biosynthesis
MMHQPLHILVPRFVDVDNLNAQNLNAKALLSRFESKDAIWHCFYFHKPEARVLDNPNVRCHPLRHDRFWPLQLVYHYQLGYDAVFYTGNEWYDHYGLTLRGLRGHAGPVIATLEGLPGDEQRESWLSGKMGTEIRCFSPRSGSAWTRHHDAVHRRADSIYAISPFLAQAASLLYPGKIAILPLGIDSNIFNADERQGCPQHTVVVGAGTLYEAKRPSIFLNLAHNFPKSEFIWYGEGPLRQELLAQSNRLGLKNFALPGAVSPQVLAAALRQATLFVLPSLSEGVPKVTLEASACGLPVIAFSSYGSPVVAHGVNGFCVATDDELFDYVRLLLEDPMLAKKLGESAIELSKHWNWDLLAIRWEQEILHSVLSNGHNSQPRKHSGDRP